MTKQDWYNLVSLLISTGIAGYLANVIGKFLVAKVQSITNNVKNENLKHCLSLAEDAVISAVVAVNQTAVDDYKANGNFDKATQQKTFADVKSVILQKLGIGAIAIINQGIGDFDIWLNHKIENAVVSAKTNGQQAQPQTTPILTDSEGSV